jgi:hypothetical protein
VKFGTAPVKESARAVAWKRPRTAAGPAAAQSLRARRSAAAPATCGEDMLVPEKFTCTPSVAIMSCATSTKSAESDEVTPSPGATRSGFSTPSRRGPRLEKAAIEPRVGIGNQQCWSASTACQHGFVAYAPTVTTESASPGEPTVPWLMAPCVQTTAGPFPPARALS